MAGLVLACQPAAPFEEAVGAVQSHKVAPPESQPLFLDGFFPIGVFSQPLESFGKWKQRGINTVLETPQNHDPAAWDRAAQQAGFRIIRRPLADPRADVGRKDLLAWSQWDEPDAAGRIVEWTPLFERTYAEWKRIDPKRPVFVNFAGPDLTWFLTRSDSYSRNYASYYPRLIAAADWVANDIYPSGGWLNDAHKARRGDITLIAEPIRLLRKMTDKPQFAFIETSEVELGNVPGARCPTAPEVRGQIWLAVIEGVRGLFYFPAVVGKNGFQFDGTPPAIVSEIVKQNAVLSQLGPVLQGPINPPGLAASPTAPLAAGWRMGKGEAWLFVLNTSSAPVSRGTVSLKGTLSGPAQLYGETRAVEVSSGSLTDSFGPYEVKIYRLPLGRS
jgi:hypothetical protein